jgi:acyl-CoA thioesterase FadM
LNNGRTLTLYDLGRVPFGARTGLHRAVDANGWGLTVAGVSVRYRRRLVAFERLEMRTRCIGWDSRFFYLEQSLWRGGDCANHMLLRSAATSKAGIVEPAKVVQAMGFDPVSPPLPDWVQAWIAAEAKRPWPPAH